MRPRLTIPQERRLVSIVAAYPTPAGASRKSPTDAALEKRGLINLWSEVGSLGGPGALGQLSVTWTFAVATDEGFIAASAILDRSPQS